MYLSNVLPWKSASWEAPPPEEISRIRKEAGAHDAPDLESDGITPAPGHKDSDESGNLDIEKAARQAENPEHKETTV